MGWNYEKSFLKCCLEKATKRLALMPNTQKCAFLVFSQLKGVIESNVTFLWKCGNIDEFDCPMWDVWHFWITILCLWPFLLLGFIVVLCFSLLTYLTQNAVHWLGIHNVGTSFPLISTDFITFFPSMFLFAEILKNVNTMLWIYFQLFIYMLEINSLFFLWNISSLPTYHLHI